MAKVIMTCGKICVGKSTYAEKLRKEYKAVILSVDEITLTLFGQDAGENHDTYVERAENYLFNKSLDIIEIGVNVILDWGFWTKKERDYARNFYTSRNIECEFHYLDISDEEWRRRREKRNEAIGLNNTDAYYVDEGLAEKCNYFFQPPNPEEIDIRINM